MSYIYSPPVSPATAARNAGHRSRTVAFADQVTMNCYYPYTTLAPHPDMSARSAVEAPYSPSRSKHRPAPLHFTPTSPTSSLHTSPFIPCSPLRNIHLQEHGYPTGCTRIPQLTYSEPVSSFRSQADAEYRFPCVVFQRAGSTGLGVRVGDILKAKGNMRKLMLVDGQDVALRGRGGDGQIKARISWPGYRQDPSEQRMSTAEGLISRENLLLAVAEYVYQFTEEIRTRNIPVERGYELWAIGMHPNGTPGIDGADVIITALHHCGRSNWQPELWIPNKIRRDMHTVWN